MRGRRRGSPRDASEVAGQRGLNRIGRCQGCRGACLDGVRHRAEPHRVYVEDSIRTGHGGHISAPIALDHLEAEQACYAGLRGPETWGQREDHCCLPLFERRVSRSVQQEWDIAGPLFPRYLYINVGWGAIDRWQHAVVQDDMPTPDGFQTRQGTRGEYAQVADIRRCRDQWLPQCPRRA